jgi:hypothetical protein
LRVLRRAGQHRRDDPLIIFSKKSKRRESAIVSTFSLTTTSRRISRKQRTCTGNWRASKFAGFHRPVSMPHMTRSFLT